MKAESFSVQSMSTEQKSQLFNDKCSTGTSCVLGSEVMCFFGEERKREVERERGRGFDHLIIKCSPS